MIQFLRSMGNWKEVEVREKEKINNNSDPLNKQKRKISNWQISAMRLQQRKKNDPIHWLHREIDLGSSKGFFLVNYSQPSTIYLGNFFKSGIKMMLGAFSVCHVKDWNIDKPNLFSLKVTVNFFFNLYFLAIHCTELSQKLMLRWGWDSAFYMKMAFKDT